MARHKAQNATTRNLKLIRWGLGMTISITMEVGDITEVWNDWGISSKVPGDYTTYSQQDLLEEVRNGNSDAASYINDPRGPMVAQYDENGNLELVSAREILSHPDHQNANGQTLLWPQLRFGAKMVGKQHGRPVKEISSKVGR